MKVCIVGFGSVGQGVARVMEMKKDELQKEYGLDLELVAALDRSGAAINPEGLDIKQLLVTKKLTGKVSEYLNMVKREYLDWKSSWIK